jgi:hypothetical protein
VAQGPSLTERPVAHAPSLAETADMGKEQA